MTAYYMLQNGLRTQQHTLGNGVKSTQAKQFDLLHVVVMGRLMKSLMVLLVMKMLAYPVIHAAAEMTL